MARWFFLSPTEVIKHLESHHCASPAYTPHARYCFSCLKNITKLVFRNRQLCRLDSAAESFSQYVQIETWPMPNVQKMLQMPFSPRQVIEVTSQD